MVDIQTVSILVASASVVAGVIYYAFQLRHQTRIRETDLIIRLCTFTASREFLKLGRRLEIKKSRLLKIIGRSMAVS